MLDALEREFRPAAVAHRRASGSTATAAALGNDRELSRFAARCSVTSPMPSQFRSNAARPASRTEASIGISISSSMRHFASAAASDGLFHRLVPIGGLIGALADPAEGEDFGQLVLAEVLERPR